MYKGQIFKMVRFWWKWAQINQIATWIQKMYSLPHIKCWEMCQTRGQRLVPTQFYECQIGVDLWTLVSNILRITNYIFLNLCGNPINLCLFHFNENRLILKIWPLYKRSMTFSYFVLYLNNATSYGNHVIDFFTPYNKRNNMTCITTKLKHFEFSNAWRGVPLSSLEGVCVYFSHYIFGIS